MCDNAYENTILAAPAQPAPAAQPDGTPGGRQVLHWSVPDPARVGTDEVLATALAQILVRADRLGHALTAPPSPHRPRRDTRRDIRRDEPRRAHPPRRAPRRDRRLLEDFAGVFGQETIDRFLITSHDQFAGRATVTRFLPLIAERFARQRLRALAKVEGLREIGVPTVMLPCLHNAGLSQMALGFFQHLAGDRAVGWSGGSEPGDRVHAAAVEAMRERRIDISAEFPTPGPTRPSAPPTSSAWAAATPAPSSPASATRTAFWRTPPARRRRRPPRPRRDRTTRPPPAHRTRRQHPRTAGGRQKAEGRGPADR